MIYDFLSLLSNCLVFFVFYNLIHGLLDRLTDAGKPYAVVAIIHWVILGIVSALSVAGWGLYVAYQVYDVNHTYSGSYSLSLVYEKVWAARTILYWVVSLEILAWTIFVFAKAGSHRFNSKVRFKNLCLPHST